MKKVLITTLVVLGLFLIPAKSVSGSAVVANQSATIKSQKSSNIDGDYRNLILKSYLESYDSPLAEYSEELIFQADKYDIDWRLVAAISGVESTFGKRIPANSYNAYGWANGAYHFQGWEDSIEIVSKTLREKYYDKGAEDIYAIGRRYAPPSSTWAYKVKGFMEKIDSIGLPFTLES